MWRFAIVLSALKIQKICGTKRDFSQTFSRPIATKPGRDPRARKLVELTRPVTCSNGRMKKQDDEGIPTYTRVSAKPKGIGPGSAGQSGDDQGLSDVAEADSESVEELVEEGQSFEAEAISGVEDAPDPDVAEVHTKQVPEDDVPSEYQERD
jgi:hypothetical protein